MTPSWYPAKQAGGRVVPTWNYVAIHARGRLSCFDDPERLRALVAALTARHEAGRAGVIDGLRAQGDAEALAVAAAMADLPRRGAPGWRGARSSTMLK